MFIFLFYPSHEILIISLFPLFFSLVIFLFLFTLRKIITRTHDFSSFVVVFLGFLMLLRLISCVSVDKCLFPLDGSSFSLFFLGVFPLFSLMTLALQLFVVLAFQCCDRFCPRFVFCLLKIVFCLREPCSVLYAFIFVLNGYHLSCSRSWEYG